MKVRLLMCSLALAGTAFTGPAGAAAPEPERDPPPTNDPYLRQQWNLFHLDPFRAWKKADGKGTLIAIVDSGADLDHPDLKPKLVVRRGADIIDRDCATRYCLRGPVDEHGHGTHVAGIAAAATDNGIGIAGMAPKARILPVRVLDENNQGTVEGIAAGIRFAVDHGADIINLSLAFDVLVGEVYGEYGFLRPIYRALDYAAKKGVVVVAAAGNDSLPLCAEPAAGRQVVCVGATTINYGLAYYSNSDVTMESNYLVAPGGDGLDPFTCFGAIVSTYPRQYESFCPQRVGGYESLSGTSAAAPHVSGVAALLVQRGLGAGDILDCLMRTATDLGLPGRDPRYGYGLVNPRAAVSRC